MDKRELRKLINRFLDEDIGTGDLTGENIFTDFQEGSASLVSRQDFVVAGGHIASEVFSTQNPAIKCEIKIQDGEQAKKGEIIMTVAGPVVDLLKAERVALNLLQRMSAIATLTAEYVQKVKPYPVRVVDTRKTTPGLRILEKFAVTVGGGYNHRFNLADGVMIKDNHIAACGSIKRAVEQLRNKIPHTVKIEVESDNIDQVKECLDAGADIIMLDNMSVEDMMHAVEIISGQAIVEASGGVNLKTVKDIAATGVNIISIGALTHSVINCDIGMDWEKIQNK